MNVLNEAQSDRYLNPADPHPVRIKKAEKGCKEKKRQYVLIKDFNTFVYDHTLQRGRKQFCCCYCLHVFSTKEILKCHRNLLLNNKCIRHSMNK